MLVLLGAVAAGLASAGTADGAALTTTPQTLTIPMTQTNWQPGLPPTITNPLLFDKFDPSLGPLQSVNIALYATFNHDITLRFISPSTLTMETQGSSVVVRDPNNAPLIDAAPPAVNESVTITDGTFPRVVTIPTITQAVSNGPLSLTDPATLAMFTAGAPGEMIALPVSAVSNSAFSSSTGNGSGSINTSATASVVISYTYVPEPSALIVLGVGIAACWRSLGRRQVA